eukprot:Gb_36596 [translate_table: standard]
MEIKNYKHCKGEAALQLIEYLTSNADRVQTQVLCEILRKNVETEYLKMVLRGRIDKLSFKQNVPIVTYEDIKPLINRIADGDSSNIISAEPITEWLTSSGTSGGEQKLMPSVPEELDRKTLLYSLLMPVMNQYLPGLDKGKGMYLFFIKAERKTPSGLLARPVLTSYYKSNHFRNRPRDPFNMYTSPDEAILCPDSRQSMFCQLLCGLIQRHDVVRVGAVFASAFLRAIKFLEENWQEMCENIRQGHLSDWIDDLPCRMAVSRLLPQPDPELAQSLHLECRKKSWDGIIIRLWPQTKYIDVIVTGSMAQYIPTLNYYSGGKLPLVCSMYASSECYFGLNLNPLQKPSDVSYTLLPNMAYFEFLPVRKENGLDDLQQQISCNGVEKNGLNESEELVDLVDVQVGCYYELVVTTYTGLYRYRVGDILLVTGFHNKAPQFQFLYRRNVVLSIDADKTNEEDLHKTVTNAKKLLEPFNTLLTEYTSCADTSSIPGHYVLFWELDGRPQRLEAWVLEACCSAIEESLDWVYRRGRVQDKSIGPLEIRLVKPGTFDRLMDHCLSQGASVNQYKTPRCIKSPSALDLLNSSVTGKYFSKRLPSWAPYISSLHRYRVGDILLVTGFHNKAPQFQFLYRRNVVLSIDADKTNEEDLHKTVTNAKKLLEPFNTLLTEYTSCADTSSIPGHYVLFWELDGRPQRLEAWVLEACCSAIEESLDWVYRRGRVQDKSIGPLEIRLVKPGTFDRLMDHCLSQGASVNQYKTPRCIKSPSALELLNSSVTGKYFSKRLPSWTPYIPSHR